MDTADLRDHHGARALRVALARELKLPETAVFARLEPARPELGIDYRDLEFYRSGEEYPFVSYGLLDGETLDDACYRALRCGARLGWFVVAP